MYKHRDVDIERREYYTSLPVERVPAGIFFGYTILYGLIRLLSVNNKLDPEIPYSKNVSSTSIGYLCDMWGKYFCRSTLWTSSGYLSLVTDVKGDCCVVTRFSFS